jgi:hypothetical protein
VTEPEDASVRTVAVAVAANLVTAVAKGVAAILTGSAAMTAETAHSVADTFNEVLLYVGVRHGARHADDRHPFGYGQARYFWSLMAAVGIFVVGGLFAIADGVQTLRHPEPVTDVPVGVAVLLLVSAALEGLSWRTARRQLCARPVSATSDLGEYLATSSGRGPRRCSWRIRPHSSAWPWPWRRCCSTSSRDRRCGTMRGGRHRGGQRIQCQGEFALEAGEVAADLSGNCGFREWLGVAARRLKEVGSG